MYVIQDNLARLRCALDLYISQVKKPLPNRCGYGHILDIAERYITPDLCDDPITHFELVVSKRIHLPPSQDVVVNRIGEYEYCHAQDDKQRSPSAKAPEIVAQIPTSAAAAMVINAATYVPDQNEYQRWPDARSLARRI
jgi:hypothetical protein